jgi:fluoride ion exporter CrcB/FEX
VSALTSALLVALGGAFGALLRRGADALTARLGIAAPIGTLVVNVGGSFAAGLVVTLIAYAVGSILLGLLAASAGVALARAL